MEKDNKRDSFSERRVSLIAKLLGVSVLWLAHRLRIEVIGGDHLADLKDHLTQGSLIVPFNHRALPDPIIVAEVLRRAFGYDFKLYFPTSIKFFDGRMGKIPWAVARYLSSEANFRLLPVVQFYDREYSREKRRRINAKALFGLVKALEQPGTVVSLSPEGTRSRTGEMKRAEEGMGFLVEAAGKTNTLIVPMGIINSDRTHGIGSPVVNPFSQTQVVIGRPLSPSEVLGEAQETALPPEDIVMLHIAELLPEDYCGVYNFL